MRRSTQNTGSIRVWWVCSCRGRCGCSTGEVASRKCRRRWRRRRPRPEKGVRSSSEVDKGRHMVCGKCFREYYVDQGVYRIQNRTVFNINHLQGSRSNRLSRYLPVAPSRPWSCSSAFPLACFVKPTDRFQRPLRHQKGTPYQRLLDGVSHWA